MSAAGEDIPAVAGASAAAPTTDVPQTAEALGEKARTHGWKAPTGFDYANFENPKSGDDANGPSLFDDSTFHATAGVYEADQDIGDVLPPNPQLEQVLFGGDRSRPGDFVQALVQNATVEGPNSMMPIRKFEDAGLHPVVLDNTQKCGYTSPTTIQGYTIPAVLGGHDVVAVAQTGSGKTAAYLIPVISKLMGKAKKLRAPRPNVAARGYDVNAHAVRAEPLVIIVVPTRELAIQIFDEARRLCYRSMLRPCVAYGGLPMKVCREELGKGCDVLIATPGRLCDLMDKPHILTLGRAKFTIIDEADELLNNDWEEELGKIMSGGDANEDVGHQYLMFSATFPKVARKLAREYLAEDYFRFRIGRAGSTHENVRQHVVWVDHDAKQTALYDLLYSLEPARTLIFCNSKVVVDMLDDFLYNRQLPTTSIHSGRNQREREDALRAFRSGRAPILVATGVSARGWDIPLVKHVINYDLPATMYGGIDEYIHRIGRTARIGHKGLATSFYNDKNDDISQALVNVLIESKNEVPEFLNHLAPAEAEKPDFEDDTDSEEEQEAGGDAVDEENAFASGFAADTGDEEVAAAAPGWGAPAPEPTAAAW
ncbi:hypothetical protein MBLNU230_g6928t1 [Neophaeotheca triangularis]